MLSLLPLLHSATQAGLRAGGGGGGGYAGVLTHKHEHDDLHWEQLSVAVGPKVVLQPCSGRVRAGRLLGVLGPSGAGKTTALGAIVDGVPAERRKRFRGWLAGTSARLSGGKVALLSQDDSFFGLLTVRETLQLATALQPAPQPAPQPTSQRTPQLTGAEEERVEELLRTLGLWDVRDSRVGDRSHPGISGGERRRLALACELLGEPHALVADEPTTGLDAYQARRLVSPSP